MDALDITIAIGWVLYVGLILWLTTKAIPHDPPKLPPDLEDIRRPKK